MTKETSKVLTLVFTDLADSTALKSERGDQAVDELIAQHREHVTRIADESLGRVIDWAGDGCFLTFETSSAGVMFALRLQQAHADEPDLPAVRIGIHLGEVTEKSGPGESPRIEGLAVDVAARVQGLAKPGQVLMSSSVYNSAKQRMGVDTLGQPILWQLHGLYDLKGFDHPLEIGEAGIEGVSPLEAPGASEKANPVALSPRQEKVEVEILAPTSKVAPRWVMTGWMGVVVAALIAALAYVLGQQRAVSPEISMGPIETLAVLPFDNYSGDVEQEFFVDGMTDMLTAELSKLSSLTVKARTSAMRYKDTDMSLSEIARELDVQVLVEGSVFRSGNEVRITAQLVRGDTEEHLWGDNYTGSVADALQLQSDVALDIVGQIHAAITPGERDRIVEIQTENPAALDEYLRGRYFWNKRTPDALEKSIEHFELATVLDPNYAEAYAGLAETYVLLPAYSNLATPLALEKVRAMAKRALELDETLAAPHAALGFALLYYEWNFVAAEDSFRRAIELDPNHPTSHHWYAFFLVSMGRHEESVRETQTALRLDPVSLIINEQVGYMLWGAREYDRAITQLNSTLEMDPDFWNSLIHQSYAYLETDRLTEARITVERLIRVTKDSGKEAQNLEVLGLLQVREGDRAAAETTVARLMEIASEQDKLGDSASGIRAELSALSSITIALGQIDTGFEWLERAFKNRYWALPSRLATPRFDPVRSDPRFHSLLRRMNYPEDAFERLTEPLDSADAPIKKIAVLPFDNMSSDPEQVYFVDGMTEALIAELAKIKSIKVISRTSIMQYKDTDKSIPEIARELGVDALIEGSVMKAGNDVRITAQLVHGITDEHLWAETYTNTLENVFKLQAEVALAITDEINAVVTPDERTRITSAVTVNPEAYRLYAQGRHYLDRRTDESLRNAQRLFERAIEIDADFALPHAGIAEVYGLKPTLGLGRTTDAIPLAVAAAQRALEIDPNLGEAYATLGRTMVSHEWDWAAAEAAFLRAIELNPGFATAYMWYGRFLSQIGRDDEAVEYSAKGYQLDPLSPNVAGMYCRALLYDGQVELGLQQIEEAARMHSESSIFNFLVGSGLIRTRDFEAASQYLDRAMEIDDGGFPLVGAIGVAVKAAMGNHEVAREGLERLIQVQASGKEITQAIVWTYAALGDTDAALEWFERGIEGHESGMENVPRFGDPFMESIKSDPRYLDLLRRMNYPVIEETN